MSAVQHRGYANRTVRTLEVAISARAVRVTARRKMAASARGLTQVSTCYVTLIISCYFPMCDDNDNLLLKFAHFMSAYFMPSFYPDVNV
jgi:hypothetical protein